MFSWPFGRRSKQSKPKARPKSGAVTSQFHTLMAGVHQLPGAVQRVRALRCGDEVTLVREPDNAYDKNAVAVFSVKGERLGYIPATVAVDLARAMDEDDAKVRAIVVEKLGTGRDVKRFNALLHIHQVRRSRRRG